MQAPGSRGAILDSIDDPVLKQAYEDAMEDVHTRFLLNLPPEELATADRILFQIEQAWWFYEDHICDQDASSKLPRFKHLKAFADEMFQYSFLLDRSKFNQMWESFGKYKRKISTYGTILLNSNCSKVILCQEWNSKAWTFPAGKINQGEEGIDAAARETWEETGFDPNREHGLTASMADMSWQSLQKKDALSFVEDTGKRRTCYVCKGVPEDFPFEPVARKEVSCIRWHGLDEIPKKSYAVLPFMPKLRKWIKKRGKEEDRQKTNSPQKPKSCASKRDNSASSSRGERTPLRGNNDKKKTPNRERAGSRKKSSRSRSRTHEVQEGDILTESGLAQAGDKNGWSEEDMFQANEKLIGRKVEYDGNPHVFSEQGFQGNDPHAFHVVGGTFMNSGKGISSLAPPPPTSRLQKLFREESKGTDDADAGLQPFFTQEGVTPWGDIVTEAAVPESDLHHQSTTNPDPSAAREQSNKAHQRNRSSRDPKKKCQVNQKVELYKTDEHQDDDFMTDAQITTRSQLEKTHELRMKRAERHQADQEYITDWVNNLPKAPPSRIFGEFHFDVEALLAGARL